MFVVDKTKNRITKIQSHSFSELGFKEREHLQEWLENHPDAFGEELLFIQKEFDRFDDTRERLDLLAIDKTGNLVVIENKLDDSGRDVTWQAQKYAAYCSTLSKQQIKDIYQQYLNKKQDAQDSETLICEFLEKEDFSEVQLNETQRIILVAANYRKEVTSTVLWLLNNYGLQIQCFKVTPYKLSEQIFLNIEQILPVKEAADYTIKMAEKKQEEKHTKNELETRHKIRLEFWKELLHRLNERTNLFANINPIKESWIGTGAGVSGVGFYFSITKKYVGTQVDVNRGIVEENQFVYKKLLEYKEEIEAITGKLDWEQVEGRKTIKIKNRNYNLSLYEKDDWDEMMEFMMESMLKMESAFRKPLQKINQELKALKNA